MKFESDTKSSGFKFHTGGLIAPFSVLIRVGNGTGGMRESASGPAGPGIRWAHLIGTRLGRVSHMGRRICAHHGRRGGGTFTGFHKAGANVNDLELLALRHLHPDHLSAVPALLWIKPTNLVLSGPKGSDGYPSTNEHPTGLFGSDGAFRAVREWSPLRSS